MKKKIKKKNLKKKLLKSIFDRELKETEKLLEKELLEQKTTRNRVSNSKYLQQHDVMLLEQHSHMIGYLTAKNVELKNVLELLNMNYQEIVDMLEKHIETKKVNDEYLKEIFKNIQKKNQKS